MLLPDWFNFHKRAQGQNPVRAVISFLIWLLGIKLIPWLYRLLWFLQVRALLKFSLYDHSLRFCSAVLYFIFFVLKSQINSQLSATAYSNFFFFSSVFWKTIMTWEIFIFPNKEPNSVSSVRFNSTEPFCSCFSSFSHLCFYLYVARHFNCFF